MTSCCRAKSLFLGNNLLFMGILIVVFWGVIFPLISELFTGQKVTVGPPWYNRATGPLWAGLLLLMGVSPVDCLGPFDGQNPWESHLETAAGLTRHPGWHPDPGSTLARRFARVLAGLLCCLYNPLRILPGR